MSIFRNEEEMRKFAMHLLGEGREVSEAADGGYRSDKERREMVRQLRKVEQEHIEALKAGDSATAAEKEKEARKLIEELFKEVEMMIYNLANDLSSGPTSTRSQYKEGGNAMNDAEDLKAVGVMEFIRIVEGGRGRINPDGSVNLDFKGDKSFDPDGPGTFASFVWKSVNGAMLNSHAKEEKHRGNLSLDAPVGEDGDAELGDFIYNDVFVDDSGHFEIADDGDNRSFINSEAFHYLNKIIDDVTKGSKRQLDIFCDYYGIRDHEQLTPTQIAAKLGVSKQYVNNVITTLMARIDDYLIDDDTIDGYVLKLTDKDGNVTWASGPKSYKGQVKDVKDATYLSDRLLRLAVPYWEGKGYEVRKFDIDKPLKEGAEVSGSGSKVCITFDGKKRWAARNRPTAMTSRESDAAVLGGEELEQVVSFFQGLATGTEYGRKHGMSVEKVRADGILESASESSLDGKTLKQARSEIAKAWSEIPSNRIYKDPFWEPVHKFFTLLYERGIRNELVESRYEMNADGNPSSKRWTIEFPFRNQLGKDVKVVGTLVASGAGTVEDPLSSYDVCFYVF